MRKDKVLSVFFFSGRGGECTWLYVCVCAHTHTHICIWHVGSCSRDVSPGIGTRHLEGPKNPDRLNLGIHVFAYVFKVHMCVYMLEAG